jgi:predicted AlkP superfamily pyrophosphatase or phosphodiesterase
MGKRVLLCVIDGWTSRTFLPASKAGKLPNFLALSRAGHLNPSCVTIFPSITPAALASIVTGGYPKDHGIMGAYWYDTSKKEVIYYGDDFWVVLQQGIGRFIRDFLIKLNHQRLRTETIFQKVERAGLRSACLNHLIFRGDVDHKLRLSPLLKLLGLIPGVSLPKRVSGPSILYLGDLASTGTEIPAGLLRRYGFEDNYTVDLLIHLVESKALPDLTVAYFPSYDKLSHKVGPEAAMTELETLDARLGDLFEAFGGLEQMLKQLCIVMTADHSISDVKTDKAAAGIRLDELLSGFHIAGAGKAWSRGEQIKVCPTCARPIFISGILPRAS